MQEIKPHLDKLKEKHKGDSMALNKAQMDLYKEHGVNPAGGCVPSVLQILLIIPIYQVIQAMVDPVKGLEKINHFLYPFLQPYQQLPNPYFLGLNLTQKPSDFFSLGHAVNWSLAPIILVPIVTALLQFLLSGGGEGLAQEA
jgi:YidC/Oxa1 family membrane protein insertase